MASARSQNCANCIGALLGSSSRLLTSPASVESESGKMNSSNARRHVSLFKQYLHAILLLIYLPAGCFSCRDLETFMKCTMSYGTAAVNDRRRLWLHAAKALAHYVLLVQFQPTRLLHTAGYVLMFCCCFSFLLTSPFRQNLKIYRTDLCQICRFGRTVALDD